MSLRKDFKYEDKSVQYLQEYSERLPASKMSAHHDSHKHAGGPTLDWEKRGPPSFSNLNKDCKDLFTKGYNFGFLKVESKTTVPRRRLELRTGASHNVASGKLNGFLEANFKLPQHGLILKEKYTTENVMSTEVSIEDKIYKGVKLTVDTNVAPHIGKRHTKLKSEHVTPWSRVAFDASLEGASLLAASGVFRLRSVLLGVHSSYNTVEGAIESASAVLGVPLGPGSLATLSIDDKRQYAGSLYQRVCHCARIGATLGWNTGSDQVSFALAGQYDVDADWTVKGKVTNDSQLALLTQHQINPHLKVVLSTQIDLKNFTTGGQKYGLGFEYEPKADECC